MFIVSISFFIVTIFRDKFHAYFVAKTEEMYFAEEGWGINNFLPNYIPLVIRSIFTQKKIAAQSILRVGVYHWAGLL